MPPPRSYHSGQALQNEGLQRTWQQIVGILAKRGGRFVLMPRGSKGRGFQRGWNLPSNTKSAAQALAHLQHGGNVGLASGSGNLYVFDLDANAERGHECSKIAGTLYTYRPNAPERAKFVFACPDKLPRKNKSNDVELLGWTGNGKHWNAVVAGVHETGAPVLWGGHKIVELDRETVAALWNEWTDTDLDGASGNGNGNDFVFDVDPNATGDDLLSAAIEQARAGGDRNTTGFRLAGGVRDRLIAEAEARTYMLRYQQTVAGWGSHPYTVAEALASLRSAYSHPPRPRPPQEFYEHALQAKAHVLSAAAAAHFREIGIMPDTGRAVTAALIDIMIAWGKPDVHPGLHRWALDAGVALSTLQRALAKFVAAGIVTHTPGEPGHASTFELQFGIFGNPPKTATTPPPTATTTTTTTPNCMGLPKMQNYSRHRADDAFRNNHAAYKRRKPDGLAPLGRSALIGVVAGGKGTVKQIAAQTGQHPDTVRRYMQRLVRYGLATVETGRHNTKVYRLADDWALQLDTLRPRMMTAGVQLRRELAYAEQQLARERDKQHPDPVRLDKLSDKYNRYAATLGWNLHNPAQHVRRQRPRFWLRWDTSERDTELQQARQAARELRQAGHTASETRLLLAYAGYSEREAATVWAREQLEELSDVWTPQKRQAARNGGYRYKLSG